MGAAWHSRQAGTSSSLSATHLLKIHVVVRTTVVTNVFTTVLGPGGATTGWAAKCGWVLQLPPILHRQSCRGRVHQPDRSPHHRLGTDTERTARQVRGDLSTDKTYVTRDNIEADI